MAIRLRHVLGVVSVAVMVVGFGLLPSVPAGAVNCARDAVKSNVADYTPTTNGNLTHFGTKASTGIYVFGSPTPECVRISSILTVTTGGAQDEAEIGWIEDPQQAVGGLGCQKYPLGGTIPRRWVVAFVNGVAVCLESSFPKLTTGQFEPMNVHETIAANSCSPTNNSWDFVDNTSTVSTLAIGFCSGISTTNGERHSIGNDDSAKSNFDGMQVFLSTQTWGDWADNGFCLDDDPSGGQVNGYDPAVITLTHNEVLFSSPDNFTRTFKNACFQ